MIDYERLLKWYIKHVVENEGVDYLRYTDFGPWGNEDLISEEEKQALFRAAGRNEEGDFDA